MAVSYRRQRQMCIRDRDNVNGGEKGGINGGDNFGDKARIREKAQKLTDIRKGTHAVL